MAAYLETKDETSERKQEMKQILRDFKSIGCLKKNKRWGAESQTAPTAVSLCIPHSPYSILFFHDPSS